MKISDSIVIGGGLQGLLTARQLAQAGLSVCVIERGRLGQESSWAAGGILSPLHPWTAADAVTELATAGQEMYPALAEELREATGIDPEWLVSGLLTQADDDIGAIRNWSARRGISLELLGKGVEERFPAVTAEAASWVWQEKVAQIRPPRLLKALIADLRHKGVELIEGLPVISLMRNEGRIIGVDTVHGCRGTDRVVVASGAWSAALLGETVPGVDCIRPVAGEMLLLAAESVRLNAIVCAGSCYLIPRADGQIVCGSTLEWRGYDRSISIEARTQLFDGACRLVPSLRDASIVQQWSGLRPWAAQGIPYVCAHPEISGLYLNTGHYRNGIVLAPSSARLTADLILGRHPFLNPRAFALDAIRGHDQC